MSSAVDTSSINIFHENEYIFLNKEGGIYHTKVEVDYVKDDVRKHKILYLNSNPEEDSDKIDQIKKIYEKTFLEYVLKSENRFFNSKKTFSEDDLIGCTTCLKLGKVNLNAEVLKKILNVFHKTLDYKQRFFANSNYIISISSKSKFFEDINHDICVHNSRVANNKKISKAKVVIYPNSTGYFTIPGLRIKHGQFKQLTTSLFFDSKEWFLVERVKIFKEKRNRGLSLKIIQNLKTISSFSFDVDKPIVINIVKKVLNI